MRIRLKLGSIIVVAVLIPLVLSVLAINRFGKAGYMRQIGGHYRTIAQELKDTLQQGVDADYRRIIQWIKTGMIPDVLDLRDVSPLDMEGVDRIEREWDRIVTNAEHPLHRQLFGGALTERLNFLQTINPEFSELLVTDRFGRLVGASNPTTDYWQADEAWWQQGHAVPAGSGMAHAVTFDESAGVLAIDLVFPIHAGPDGEELLGVLKVSLHAESLFHGVAPRPWNSEITRDICFPDGEVLTRINAPPGSQRELVASTKALALLVADTTESRVVEIFPGIASLGVAVPICLDPLTRNTGARDATTLYIVVHRDVAAAMAPVSRMVRGLIWSGIVVAAAFAILSYLMASVWVASPLLKLRWTALSITEHIRQSEEGQLDEARASQREAYRNLKDLRRINRGDELSELATDFARMGARVLNFNRELERELTEKTEEINADLLMAREFQEALLPQGYPDMTVLPAGHGYALHFDHIYRPALSVSGDFFDISKESENCVRVFIADVMGHGARSALMTAVLHALIHSVEKRSGAPADLLQRMNREFYAIGSRTEETLFVTAVHMIIDVCEGTICYASAGHPAPLLLDHDTGVVVPLQTAGRQDAAVGLFRDVAYNNHTLPISGNQTVVLYTDGVTEAMNVKGEEFGMAGLVEAITHAHRDNEHGQLPAYILENIETFMNTAPTMDDICLVSVEITRPRG